jgi:hypothetical protein
MVDTTVAGLGTAQSKVDADAGTSKLNDNTTATSLEATYQTDRTSLKGADTGLQVVVSGNPIPLSAANPGVV